MRQTIEQIRNIVTPLDRPSFSFVSFPFVAPVLAVALLFPEPLRADGYHPQWVLVASSRDLFVRLMVVGEFTGDGVPDLAVISDRWELHLMPIEAGGQPAKPMKILGDATFRDLVAADFDGDGRTDLVATNREGNAVTFLRSNGDGTFSARSHSLDNNPWDICVDDFDGDGEMDLLVGDGALETVVVYRGDGAGAFSELSRISTDAVTELVSGDVDGDGRMDLLAARGESSGLRLFYGTEDGRFETPVPFDTPSWVTKTMLVDLDEDGDLEILDLDFYADTLTVRVNLGSRTFASPVRVSSRWSPQACSAVRGQRQPASEPLRGRDADHHASAVEDDARSSTCPSRRRVVDLAIRGQGRSWYAHPRVDSGL